MIQTGLNIVLEGSVKETLEQLNKFKERPYNGILITGKPGTGKTFLCKYFAQINDCCHLFFNCVNEFSNLEASQMIELIKQERKKLVFFDELEYFSFVQQEKYYKLMEIIKICQEQEHKLIFITQSPEKLDLYPKKLPYDRATVLLLPENKFREQLIANNLPSFKFLSGLTDSYSVSDLIVLIKDIQMEPLKTIINCDSFELIDEKYHPTQDVKDSSVLLSYDQKLKFLQEGKIQIKELEEKDVRRILNEKKRM
ncbi:unnamed protein product (macronuclear) [Paramecium tetraurelia]|uniref:AAA+ ATPase domain-containing protein n=1 Tax=Paramecium tetraurelia TaxID=5888 RepID=A0BJL7_PARTE|nr:uncharacterized protein GSPATT00029362001 [Paramecium tetraurelia]CAK58734.1 unnamed protein product [Paramecium tetraurelia]|eukprot:XP_001426132.1 hypothetical protein (macronuclear) [Paramecium tetraurelia strain d4-2]